MEADCFSGNWPQNVLPGHEILVAIKRKSSTTFFRKNVTPLLRSIPLRGDTRRLLHR